MIDYEIFRFASPPRTANTWFRKVMAEAGLGAMSAHYQHVPCPPGGALVVTMVRHPVVWLTSYYLHVKGGHVGVSDVDRFAPLARQSANLDAFLLAYLGTIPGAVGWMFDAYDANTVLRVEDLPWAILSLLEASGVDDATAMRASSLPPQNVYKGTVPKVSSRIQRAIIGAEKQFCEEYGYV